MDTVFKTEKGTFNYRVVGVWIENGHVLLHKDVNDTSWSLPGGRAKITEDSKTALRREFLEELSIDVEVNKLCWIVENFFTYRKKNFHEIGLYYCISTENNTVMKRQGGFYGAESKRLVYKWFPVAKLNEIELQPAFLRLAINDLPEHTEHLIERQEKS